VVTTPLFFCFFLFPALKGGKKLGVDFFNFLITLVNPLGEIK